MKYICDTCVLIDYLRGKKEIGKIINKDRSLGLAMSSVTYMELIVGARNKQEVNLIKKTFADFEIIEINESISIKAKKLIEKYSKSHGLLIPDALIAATSLEMEIPLYTWNISDFKFITDIEIYEK